MNPEFSALLSFAFRPSHGLLLIAVAGWAMWRFGGLNVLNAGRRMVQVAVIALALIVLTPLPYLTIMPLEDRFEIPSPPTRVDGIILLSGGEQETLSALRSDAVFTNAGERAMLTARLAHLYPEARVLVTGSGGHDLTQAEISANFLKGVGVESDRILVEKAARNTRENATHALQLAAPAADEIWILVTSAYHMPRSVGTFRNAGWTVVPWPTDYRRAGTFSDALFSLPIVTNEAETFDVAFHEWAGLVAYRLSGWTDDLFPAPNADD